ncbi:hypothetical protein Tco_0654489, partial [Tanacetum coccineum]
KSRSEASGVLSIMAMICWFILRSRCAFVYDNVDLFPERTLASINAQLHDFDKIMASRLNTKAVCPHFTSQTSQLCIPPTSLRFLIDVRMTAITLSSTKTIPPWNLAALVSDIRSWSTNLKLSFSWTKRDNNKVAH